MSGNTPSVPGANTLLYLLHKGGKNPRGCSKPKRQKPTDKVHSAKQVAKKNNDAWQQEHISKHPQGQWRKCNHLVEYVVSVE